MKSWTSSFLDRGLPDQVCTECGSNHWLVQTRVYISRGMSVYPSGHYGVCANCGKPAILSGAARVPRWAREQEWTAAPVGVPPRPAKDTDTPKAMADADLKWGKRRGRR